MNCAYGCGNKAKFEMTSGKMCCSPTHQSCPAIRQKNSEANIGIPRLGGEDHPRPMTGVSPWNKGLNKRTSAVVAQYAKSVSLALKGRPGRSHSEESRRKISRSMKAHPNGGGYRPGSGVGKKGWYKGMWCDSSWELAFLLWCEAKKIKVERNTESFEYVWKGRKHTYIPDFIVKDFYVEIKGFYSLQWKAKQRAFPYELKVGGPKTMIGTILPFVIDLYGEDFVRLYE